MWSYYTTLLLTSGLHRYEEYKLLLCCRISISLAILSKIFIQISYFFLRVMQENKRGCFFLNTVYKWEAARNGNCLSRMVAIFSYPTCIRRSCQEAFPSVYCHNAWCGRTRMMCLSDGEKNLKMRLLVLIEYTNVTDRRTDRHRTTAYAALMHSLARQKRPLSAAAAAAAAAVVWFCLSRMFPGGNPQWRRVRRSLWYAFSHLLSRRYLQSRGYGGRRRYLFGL